MFVSTIMKLIDEAVEYVSENSDVLPKTAQADIASEEVFLKLVKALRAVEDEANSAGYAEGHLDGFCDARSEYHHGLDVGYQCGFNEGYRDGYDNALRDCFEG